MSVNRINNDYFVNTYKRMAGSVPMVDIVRAMAHPWPTLGTDPSIPYMC